MKFDSKQVWLFVILSSFCDENAEALQYVAQGDEDPRSISLERVKLMLVQLTVQLCPSFGLKLVVLDVAEGGLSVICSRSATRFFVALVGQPVQF